MASNYQPADAAQWRIAVRFLTFGIMVAGLIAVMWWLSRLADHLENQRELLLEIRRDVLVIQSRFDSAKVGLDENARRLVTVEERAAAASEDRRAMRATDQQLTDAMIRLRAGLDDMRERIDAPPGTAGMTDEAEPGPKTRPRLRRE